MAPMASIARALADRGIETTLMAPRRYASLVPAGVAFATIGADEVFESVFGGAAVWHPRSGLPESWRYYGAAMRSGYAAIAERWSPDDTLLVGSSFAVAARLAEESPGFDHVGVHLAPALMFSADRPPVWPAGRVPARWPRLLKRAAVRAAERWLIDPVIRAHVDPFRRELGLAAVRSRFFSQWIHARRRVVHAFPRWFAEPADDWPAQGRFAAFPCHPKAAEELSPALQRFVAGGQGPLVVVTAGTAVAQRPRWIDALLQALRPEGARFVLIGPRPAGAGSPDMLELAHAPFARLLPRAQLIVHHGGIGTLAEAMRAGIPQVLVPAAHDQPDNAERARSLGIAQVLGPSAGVAEFRRAWHWATATAALPDALRRVRQRILADGDGARQVADHALALAR